MRQRALSMILILLLLLLVPLFAASVPLSAAEEVLLTETEIPVIAQFSVYGQQSSDVCSSGVYTDSVTLKNKGTLSDRYRVTIDAADPVQDWIVVSDPVVSLETGEEQRVSLYIKTPPSSQGIYSYNVLVTSTYDGTQVLEKTLTAAPCHTLVFKTFTPTQKSCACGVSVFLLELMNTGKATEKYSLWLEGIDAASYELSAPSVKLGAGERKTIYAYTRLPCNSMGTFPLTAHVQSSFSNDVASVPLSLEVLDCAGSGKTSQDHVDNSSTLYTLYLTYLFYTVLIILVLVLLVVSLLLLKRAFSWKGIARGMRRYHFLLPLCLGLGVFFLVIGAFAYPLIQEYYKQKAAVSTETGEETTATAPENTEEPLFTPLETAGILVGVLVVVGLLAWCWKHRAWCTARLSQWKKEKRQKKSGKKGQKEKITAFAKAKQWTAEMKSAETATRVKPVLKWCWMIFLLLLLLVGIGAGLHFLYPQYKADTAQFVEQQNTVEENIQTINEKIEALTAVLDELKQEASVPDEVVADVQKELSELQDEKEILEETVDEGEGASGVLETIDEEILSMTPSETARSSLKTVLIFDVSLSGQIEEAGKSRFARGLEHAQAYIEPEGSYSIMIVGKNALIIKRDVSAAIAIHALRTLRPLDTQSNLGKALYAAAEEISNAPGRIVLISDLVTTDGTDIYDIRAELMKDGFDVVFLALSSVEVVSEESADSEETAQEETVQEETKETAEELSEVEEKESETPVFDVASEAQGNFFIEIPKNTAYRIDLNTYFVDEDADLLTYTATPGEHLSATVEEKFVTLTPEADWTGETAVQFTADDRNGGVAESPVIRVIVSEEDASPPEVSYIPWIILGSIIALIIVSLISGAFARKFHQDPGMPPPEE